jgi:PKD repeat protein
MRTWSALVAGAVLLLVLACCPVQAAGPAISLETMTNGLDADTPPGPSITVGSTVQWTYVVANTGDVRLTNVAVTDDRGVTVSAPKTSLEPFESMTATATGTAVSGQYANVGTVTGTPPNGPDVTASDPSHYLGVGQLAPPVANFTASPTSGVAPFYVAFTDTSSGDGITEWSWEFGDGGTQHESSPHHLYRAAGNFTVNLTVTGAGGSDSASRTITVIAPAPAIDLELEVSNNGGATWDDADTAPGLYVVAGTSVLWRYTVTNTGNIELAGINLTDDQLGPVEVPGYWRLAPGQSGMGQSGMTAVAGPYANTATVTAVPWDNPAGNFLEGASPVAASDPCHYFGTPTFRANFTANATAGIAPLAVAFTDTSTGDGIVTRSWEFGDGGTSTERDPVHVYAAPGIYSVNLTITNGAAVPARMPKPDYITVTAPPITGADRAYYLVSTVPAGAEIYLEGLGGTRYHQGNTSAGPLNVTLCLTCTPVRKIVATLPGYMEAAYPITAYPARGETVAVCLTLQRGTDSPFPGPHVPSTVIQAEDFDAGGEGVAYHDYEPRNLGGAYRPSEGVDIENVNGVTDVGWIRSGEYLRYTVDTTIAGDFWLTLRAANPDPAAKTVTVSLDGEPAGQIAVGGTGGWTTYREFATPAPFTIATGRHVVTLGFEGVNRVNLDWLLLAAGAAPTATPTVTATATTAPPSGAAFAAVPLTARHGVAVKFALTPRAGKTVKAVWWSFDAPAHLYTWNSRALNPTFYYPAAGTFSPYVKITYTDGTIEEVRRAGYIRAT